MSYHRPESLVQAVDVLAATGARVLAGGTDLYPAFTGKVLPGAILDLTAISNLRGISKTPTGWRIGATTTWFDIANANLPTGFAALQQAARMIGALQVQNAATIGGNLCNASPAADGVPPLLVLDAEVELTGPDGARQMPLQAFIQGVRKVALRPGEILSAIHISKAASAGGAVFEKLGARKYMVISISMVAARILVLDGKVQKAAISVGAASPVACRLEQLEHSLLGFDITDLTELKQLVSSGIANRLAPIKDIRADQIYRLHAAEELVVRAVAGAMKAVNA